MRKTLMSGTYNGVPFDYSVCTTPYLYSAVIKDVSILDPYISNTDYLFGVSASTECTATINNNYLLHIPYLSYVDPTSGTQSLWADFVYEFNPMNPTLILFKLSSDDIIFNLSYLCAASTLTYDLKIHIPDVLLPDGSTHLWVNLEYDPALSTDGNAFFVVANCGAVTN
jgi:hypothetical protein